MIDPITLQKLAEKLEIDGLTVLREYIQIQFFQELYRRPDAGAFYFKKGTAPRLIYGSSRFSEDLDFTSGKEKEDIEKILEYTKRKLNVEMSDITVKLTKTPQGFSEKISFTVQIASQPMTVKLDFSEQKSVLEPMKSPIQTGILPMAGVILVNHLSAKEIIAEKNTSNFSQKKRERHF